MRIGKQVVSQILWAQYLDYSGVETDSFKRKFYNERIGDRDGVGFKAIRRSILLGAYELV